MDLIFIIKTISTVVVATIGWVVAHYFTSRRDLACKRREIKTQYLIAAYRKLDSAIDPENHTKEWCICLQDAFSDIQLFGTQQQIKLAHEFAGILLQERKFDQITLKRLLQDLRNDLRREIGLELSNSNIGHIRIQVRSDQSDT